MFSFNLKMLMFSNKSQYIHKIALKTKLNLHFLDRLQEIKN